MYDFRRVFGQIERSHHVVTGAGVLPHCDVLQRRRLYWYAHADWTNQIH